MHIFPEAASLQDEQRFGILVGSGGTVDGFQLDLMGHDFRTSWVSKLRGKSELSMG